MVLNLAGGDTYGLLAIKLPLLKVISKDCLNCSEVSKTKQSKCI